MSRNEWPRLPFSEVVDINPKRALKKGQMVPFVEMAALPTSGPKIQYVQQRIFENGGSRFANGDTLFARITPCAENGKIGFVDCLTPEQTGLGSTEFIVFGPRDGVTDPRFVYHLARSGIIRKPALGRMIGTTGRQRVPNSVFDDILVSLPPIPEQRRIAEILSSVDEAIQTAQAVNDQIEVLRKKSLEDFFPIDVGREFLHESRFEGWKIVPANQVTLDIVDCKNRTPLRTDSGYAVVRTPNVRNGRFVDKGLHYTDEANFMEWTRKGKPRAGDILFTREAPFGEVCAAPENIDFCLGQRMMFFRPNPAVLSSSYLLYALQSAGVQRDMLLKAGGSTVGHLRVNDIRNLPVPVAPKQRQEEIASFFAALDEMADSGLKNLEQLSRLKATVMSDLLTGRKRVVAELPMAAE